MMNMLLILTSVALQGFLNKESFEKAKKYVDEHTDIIHFNGKFKPWKSDYKGELDGYWHHFDCMPSYKARRYYSETA